MASVNFKKTTRAKFNNATPDNSVFYRVVNEDGSEDLYFGSQKLNNLDDIEAAIKTITDKIGNIPDGSTIMGEIEKVQSEAIYDDTTIKAEIAKNTSAIGILNSDVTTEGSVKKQVAEAVAGIVNGAPEAYDTLKEISDWISTHADSASTMNSQIIANMNAIAEINKILGTSLPEDTNASNLIEYITETINNAIAKLDSTITATDGSVLTGITIENGLITDKTEMALGSAATMDADAFDAAGSAAAILGNESDTSGTNTVYGLRAAIDEIDNVLTWDDLTDETSGTEIN